MESLQQNFEAWAAETSASVLKWANPTMKHQATAGWAMNRLDHCLYVLAPYLLLVLYGLYRKTTAVKKPEAAAAATDKKEKTRLPLGAALAKEPIKILQIVYNLTQVLLCAYMIVGTLLEYQAKNYSVICNDFIEEDTGMAYWLWVFYLSKILDFMDTFFMVWRGNYNQLSFLHIYHHISIYLVYWMNSNVAYTGDIYYTIVANGAVHLVMYFYYLLTTLNIPAPWKVFVTVMQLVQFVTMNAQALVDLYGCNWTPGREFPRNVTLLYLFYIMSLFVLFMEFFLRTYTKPAKKPKSA